jgi:hypothetical protein
MVFMDAPFCLAWIHQQEESRAPEFKSLAANRFKAIQSKISNELLSVDNFVPSREEVYQALHLVRKPAD